MTQTPLRQALIVAHGQPSDPEPPERHLAALAERVAAALPGWRIRSATIAAAGRLEAEVAEMPDNGLIYPMFMSDGWFVSRVLPDRLGETPLTTLPPLGFDDALPELAARLIKEKLVALGWRAAQSNLLLAAHGSGRGTRAAKAARSFADRLSPLLSGMSITLGFIEEPPFVNDAATGLGSQTLCLPFFALEGDHCREDIPQALEKANFSGELLQPLGETDEIPNLIANALSRACGRANIA
ncbi:CbiX/SirB N-terminal domain-containing protein [Shimia sp.]|uniref:CbiX/SirB N-terminal domain-containing protein n=1 Tax=Shimia sp. TaxID=1954381 RepID=UPI00329843A2